MNAAVIALRKRWLGTAPRERALLVFAAVVSIAGGGEVLLLEPALKERARLLRQIDQDQSARNALEQAAATAAPDPDAAAKQRLARLQTELRATEREFQSLQAGLVQPQHMGALLQSLLAEHQGLRLIGLKSLPVTALGDPAAVRKNGADKAAAVDKVAAAASPPVRGDEAWLYRHAVEVRVQGSYADMVSYLRAIEGLPRHVRWGDVEIDARAYPASTMAVTLFTVSLEKTWWVL